MNTFTSRIANVALPAFAACALVLAGCHDQLPTQGDSLPAEKIYFTSLTPSSGSTTGSMAIYSVDPDGANQTLIFRDGALGAPPRAGKIAYFTSQRASGGFKEYRVMLCNTDGTGAVQLAMGDDKQGAVGIPALSPDGKKVVYSAHPTDLFIVNADGTGKTQLSSTAGYETNPAFSPDGTRLAFYGSDSMLYVVSANGGVPVKVADGAKNHGDNFAVLSWAPTGDRIAFARMNGAGGIDIAVADLAGGVRTVVSSPAGAEAAMPVWSADGSRIAFITTSAKGWVNSDLMMVNADGTGLRKLVTGGTGSIWFPQWSSDGRKLLYTIHMPGQQPDEGGDLMMLDVASLKATRLAQSAYKGFWVR